MADKELKAEGMVEIKKTDLEKLLSTVDRQAKDIEILYKVADKSRLSEVKNEDRGGNLIRSHKIWQWTDGRFIIATKLIKNQAEVINGRYIEDQVLELMFEDGTTLQMSYLEFSRHKKTVAADVLSKRSVRGADGEDAVILKVQFPDGKELEVDQRFTN